MAHAAIAAAAVDSEAVFMNKAFMNRPLLGDSQAFWKLMDLIPLMKDSVQIYQLSHTSQSKTIRDAAALAIDQIAKYWDEIGELIPEIRHQHAEREAALELIKTQEERRTPA